MNFVRDLGVLEQGAVNRAQVEDQRRDRDHHHQHDRQHDELERRGTGVIEDRISGSDRGDRHDRAQDLEDVRSIAARE